MKRLFLFCLVTYCVQFANAQFSGKGSGTAEDPYLVSTPLHVEEIRYFQGEGGVVFKLINDIDMSDLIADTYKEEGWNPLPDFQGELDGNGHTISGLFINRPSVENVGFFANVNSLIKNKSNAYIHDLILDYCGDVIGLTVGGLCGSSYGCVIERCMIKGKKIFGKSIAGGLLGTQPIPYPVQNHKDILEIKECVVECDVIKGVNVGGLVGSLKRSPIRNIYNNRVCTNIIGESNSEYSVSAGGIVGTIDEESVRGSKIYCNMFEGQVSASCISPIYTSYAYAGGVMGFSAGSVYSNVAICDSIITYSKATPGSAYGGGILEESYRYAGRICGYGGAYGPTLKNTNRAYNQMTVDHEYPTDSPKDGMGVGMFLLKNGNMYRSMDWDMDNVWTIDDGNSYPRLKWEVDKGLSKPLLTITNQGAAISENDELTFLAEKVTTNLGGGISYTYYQCIPDEPIIENTSSRSQQVTVTITSEDFSHLKWAGINGQEADMKEATETRTCQLERSASIPLKLHAIFAEQDFGSYTANVQVSCDNFTRNFIIRFINENPNKPVCPTPFIDYADGKLTFSCDIDGTPEYHVNISDPDVNTFTVNGELQLERTYNVEVFATAEGYQPSESANLILCWIDKDLVEFTDGLEKEIWFPLKIRTNNGAVSVSGVLSNVLVSAYSLDGILLDSTTSASGTVNLKIPANTETVILKFGDNSIKVRIK